MKKSFKKIIASSIATISILGVSCFNIYATSRTITVSTGQAWTYMSSETRTQAYGFLSMKLNAVYPQNGGTDNFRYLQGSANSNAQQLCNVVTLDEQYGGGYYPDIYEGMLNTTSVQFKSRGNDPDYAAKADVNYYAN